MSQKSPCCTKCEGQGMCHTSGSCCLECHFNYEERVACPYLSPQARADLRAQHRRLIDAGFPTQEVAKHAAAEMHLFRRYCPKEIVDLIEADHKDFERGALVSRKTR